MPWRRVDGRDADVPRRRVGRDAALRKRPARPSRYVDDATFRFTHYSYLKTLRHSVQDDIARQCREEQQRRRSSDKLHAREKAKCARFALHARHGALTPAPTTPRDDELAGLTGGILEDGGHEEAKGSGDEPTSLALEPVSLRPEGMNLLYHAAACKTKDELLEATPHLAKLADDVYQFPLLDEAFCSHLAEVALDFRKQARQLCSHIAGDTAREPARICVDKLGLTEDLATELLRRVVRPLAARLFEAKGGGTLDHQVAFFDGRAAIARIQTHDDIPTTFENRGEEAFAYPRPSGNLARWS